MRLTATLLLSFFGILITGCAAKKHKDISYINKVNPNIVNSPKLNVFTPRKASEEKKPVLIFVHGGNWNSGGKDTYGFFGRNFAKKDVITVIPNYTLSPEVSYDEMTQQTAEAIKWTQEHIADYNGDPDRIYLTGHSAGGHLVALATMNPKYGIDPTTISGIILNDAAGLDMYNYLQKIPPGTENNYLTTWTNNPETWKNASPIYYINENTPPIMMYLGSKTYPSIKEGSRRFLDALHPFQPKVEPMVLSKKHIPMILQYFWPWNKRFNEIVQFMATHR
ncbi:alpha/beta hydrolase [Aequorivita sp. CIP111184]|uniref:alpha/beta hydrolase n=1 Tax=Aequorivita sp. CIP111184 TaxID=2211356 RepID=UPI000DBBBC33|nr:alpha/beta hydrolase [Aequorivita sp. CIP111184]SRX54854.1 Carboxylesterase NlhH [Aequorivita sp. CIP111184]